MNNDELVSIVVPVYNVEKYVEKCLRSLCTQTYRNIEIIVIDDESTDGSAEIVKRFANKDDRVRYFRQLNAGLGAARNTGIGLSQGEYICFVDSDDWVTVDYVQKFVSAIISDESDLVISNIRYVFEDGMVRPRTPHINTHELVSGREAISRELIGEQYKFHAPNKFCKKTLFTENNVRFPVGKLYEDVFTTYRLLKMAEKVSLIPDYTYNYLQSRSGSIMNIEIQPRRFSDMFEALDQIISDETIQKFNLSEALQCLYVENVISLVNYLADRNIKLMKLNISKYKREIMADKNSIELRRRLFMNSKLGLISKLRAFGISHCFGLYCVVLRVGKRIQKGRQNEIIGRKSSTESI